MFNRESLFIIAVKYWIQIAPDVEVASAKCVCSVFIANGSIKLSSEKYARCVNHLGRQSMS